MTGCDLRSANLNGADFPGSLLQKHLFDEEYTMSTDFSGSAYDGARGFSPNSSHYPLPPAIL